MKNTVKNVSIAEEKWLKLLFNYSKKIFSPAPLPSHDHFHHLRVWNYSKSILLNLAVHKISYTLEEIEALLIAVFFHDMGMTITREKEHGIESANLCRQFFRTQPSLVPNSLEAILDMIEKHDDKNYTKIETVQNRPSLSVILCISDDLDAFGNIGVYRYTEIYHFRGIDVNELPTRALYNLETRFEHFTRHLGQSDSLIRLHRERFDRTRNFFLRLENEVKNPSSGEGRAKRIVQLLIEFSNGSDPDIHSLLSLAEKSILDLDGKKFFRDFLKEWDQFDMSAPG